MRIWILIFATTFIYLLFSTPGEVVINESGNINGFINLIRSNLQGKDFWKDQLKEAKEELKIELNLPGVGAELQKDSDKIDADFNRDREEWYREFPETRPSDQELLAENLREEADQIDAQEWARTYEELRLKRIDKLNKIIPFVEAHFGQIKNDTQSPTFKGKDCTKD